MTNERELGDFVVPNDDLLDDTYLLREFRLVLEEKIDEQGRRHATKTSDSVFDRAQVADIVKLLRKTNRSRDDLFST